MNVDLGRLFVTNVAIHEVPKPAPAAAALLSDVECSLDAPMKAYFTERLRTSLATAAHDVVPEAAGTSTVPPLIAAYLNATSDLLAVSQDLARRLFTVQTAVNNAGVIAVAGVTLSGARGIAILKLEKETGMRGDLQEAAGQQVFRVDLIRNLFFTEKTRVFKAAIFALEAGRVVGKVSDQQTTARNLEIAHFFLRTFLGCDYAVAPETSTRAFYFTAQGFFNERIPDAVLRTRYEMALLTEMASEHQQVQPAQFAADYLDAADRQPFLTQLGAAGAPVRAFRKDNRLIAPSLHRVEYKFRTGVRVVVQPESINAGVVTVEDLPDGRTRLEVTDALDQLNGHR